MLNTNYIVNFCSDPQPRTEDNWRTAPIPNWRHRPGELHLVAVQACLSAKLVYQR